MGFVVLAVGALMVIAGAFEMVAGSGDILSERGWSAFIAGAVLLGTGVVTSALGLVVRALESIRESLRASNVAGNPVLPVSPVSDVAPPASAGFSPDGPRPTIPEFEPAPTAPLIAAAPLGPSLVESVPPPPGDRRSEPGRLFEEPTSPAPAAEDWLDHSFAELEKEIAEQHPLPHHDNVAVLESQARSDEHASADAHAPADTHALDMRAASSVAAQELPHREPAAHEPPRQAEWSSQVDEAQTIVPEQAASVPLATVGSEAHIPAEAAAPAATAHEDHAATRVSAREEPTSPVIGRYESEGTSYVMYADGSIDAQSEAGVYRFASMAELKAFIES